METFPKFVYLACGNADGLYDPCVRFVERLKEIGHSDAVFMGAEYEGRLFDKKPKDGTESAAKKDRMYDNQSSAYRAVSDSVVLLLISKIAIKYLTSNFNCQ
jgi:hypothetical protein